MIYAIATKDYIAQDCLCFDSICTFFGTPKLLPLSDPVLDFSVFQSFSNSNDQLFSEILQFLELNPFVSP